MPETIPANTVNRITSTIIGSAIEIHKTLGPGLLEGAYAACLSHELSRTGIRFVSQKPIPLDYRGVKLDCAYRADFVVEDAVILEVKALQTLAPIHRQQLFTYLRLAGCQVGLILNFGAPTMKEGIVRVVNGLPE